MDVAYTAYNVLTEDNVIRFFFRWHNFQAYMNEMFPNHWFFGNTNDWGCEIVDTNTDAVIALVEYDRSGCPE